MIRLRPFKPSDINYMLEWFEDEIRFVQWSAKKFEYPLTSEQLIDYYHKYEMDENAWIMAALDEKGMLVGHFLMRMADYTKESVHLGFIIVDPKMRGKGYGKEMVTQATKYAFDILKVKCVTLVVFEDNEVAHKCYKAVGFYDENYSQNDFEYKGETWSFYNMAINNP